MDKNNNNRLGYFTPDDDFDWMNAANFETGEFIVSLGAGRTPLRDLIYSIIDRVNYMKWMENKEKTKKLEEEVESLKDEVAVLKMVNSEFLTTVERYKEQARVFRNCNRPNCEVKYVDSEL